MWYTLLTDLGFSAVSFFDHYLHFKVIDLGHSLHYCSVIIILTGAAADVTLSYAEFLSNMGMISFGLELPFSADLRWVVRGITLFMFSWTNKKNHSSR